MTALLSKDEDRRLKFLAACMGLRDLFSRSLEMDEEDLTAFTEECVETVLFSVGWPLSSPWWGLD